MEMCLLSSLMHMFGSDSHCLTRLKEHCRKPHTAVNVRANIHKYSKPDKQGTKDVENWIHNSECIVPPNTPMFQTEKVCCWNSRAVTFHQLLCMVEKLFKSYVYVNSTEHKNSMSLGLFYSVSLEIFIERHKWSAIWFRYIRKKADMSTTDIYIYK